MRQQKPLEALHSERRSAGRQPQSAALSQEHVFTEHRSSAVSDRISDELIWTRRFGRGVLRKCDHVLPENHDPVFVEAVKLVY